MSNIGGLSSLGTCRYGSLDFGPSVLTKGIKVRPVWDKAERTIIHSEYEITLQFWIDGGVSGAAVQNAIRQLQAPAQTFQYENRGVGGLSINTGRVKDVVWGPKPGLVDVEPGGKGGNACKLTWSVKVAIPTCSDAAFEFSAMEFNFELATDVDRGGLSTLVYSGFLRIPQTRSNPRSRTLSDTADSYLEKISPAVPVGFRPAGRNRRLSYDKCTLFFDITLEQMGTNIPPPGIIEITGPGPSYQSVPGAGTQQFTGSISLTYHLARGTPTNVAVQHFWKYSSSEMANIGGWPISAHLGPSEPYARERRVTMAASFMAPVNIAELLAAGGPWRPVNGGLLGKQAWQLWAASMAVPLGPRGEARVTFSIGDDKIVDLCGKVNINSLANTRDSQPSPLIDAPAGLFQWPTLERSWLSYQNGFRADVDQGVSILKTLPKDVNSLSSRSSGTSALGGGTVQPNATPPASGPKGNGDAGGSFFNPPPASAESKGGPPPVIGWAGNFLARPVIIKNPGANGAAESKNPPATSVQQRVKPTVFLFMEGAAVRAGYPIPAPAITDVNGVGVAIVNRTDRGEGFVMMPIGTAMGLPIYGARWRLRYVMSDSPASGAFPVLPNPLAGA